MHRIDIAYYDRTKFFGNTNIWQYYQVTKEHSKDTGNHFECDPKLQKIDFGRFLDLCMISLKSRSQEVK